MKRILFIEANRDGTVGGSHYSLLYLIQRLNKAKYEIHVLFSQDNYLIDEFKKVTPFVDVTNVRFSASGRARGLMDYIKWPYRFLNDIIFQQPLVGRILKDIKPDLVHLNNAYHCCHELMLGCFLRGIRVISHDRGSEYPADFRTKVFVRFLDAIISVSRSFMENVTRQRLKVPRVVCVHNGLDLKAFMARGGGDSAHELENTLGLQTRHPRVGIVGNIQRWKGQMVFLGAMKIISDEFPKLKCLIVGGVSSGEEEYQRELENYVKANRLGDKVIFTGYRSDIPDIIEMMDVLVHASIEPEPFGRVILEGMALAKPIVASNGGGIPELISDRENGILVPMNDCVAMAEGIRWMLLNPKEARKMGEAGRQSLIERFSIEQMVAGVERVYDELFGNSTGTRISAGISEKNKREKRGFLEDYRIERLDEAQPGEILASTRELD